MIPNLSVVRRQIGADVSIMHPYVTAGRKYGLSMRQVPTALPIKDVELTGLVDGHEIDGAGQPFIFRPDGPFSAERSKTLVQTDTCMEGMASLLIESRCC